MNIEEIALRVAEKNYKQPFNWFAFDEKELIDFAHALLAELSKDAVPVAWIEYTEDKKSYYLVYSSHPTRTQIPLFTHPAPVIASEQKLNNINDEELAERLFVTWQSTEFAECDGEHTFKTLDDGFCDSYKEAWLKVARIAKASTSPPNTADIEQRVAGNFVSKFKRHVGGDGEFWLHELEGFCEDGKWREYL